MESTGRRRPARVSHGWQWGARALVTAAALTVPLTAAASIEKAEPQDAEIGVIVRELAGAGDAPERAVVRLGGTVTRQIDLINGFSARIPSSALSALRGTTGVQDVTRDAQVTLSDMDGFDSYNDGGSLYTTTRVTGAQRLWRVGATGDGVDVAVLDSGVSPVEGLDAPGKVLHGPDLSFESQHDEQQHYDTFGHGTHMAGIIAGNDAPITRRSPGWDPHYFRGIAPNARIVSVKVADRSGAADVSQVIAGIDWIVQHRNTDGLNIRVLNLSFGTDGTQDYRLDPLAYAAEAAWRKGIVVVVSGGNAGFGSAKLNNPAYDPYVIAVGASDPKGTTTPVDDTVPSWSSAGDGTRDPDLVAPGQSIVSLRSGGSGIDELAPGGRVGSRRFFRGSGTSQAAAVVSGAAALLLDARPELAPDQVKAILRQSADTLPEAGRRAQGDGALNLRRAYSTPTPPLDEVAQTWEPSTGTGSLDAARGSLRLEDEDVELDGERDIFGNPWDGPTWAANFWNGTSWVDGDWNGVTWTGVGWSASRWNASRWTGNAWTGTEWSASRWNGSKWSASRWNGSKWSASRWNGSKWSGSKWSGSKWSGSKWASAEWGT